MGNDVSAPNCTTTECNEQGQAILARHVATIRKVVERETDVAKRYTKVTGMVEGLIPLLAPHCSDDALDAVWAALDQMPRPAAPWNPPEAPPIVLHRADLRLSNVATPTPVAEIRRHLRGHPDVRRVGDGDAIDDWVAGRVARYHRATSTWPTRSGPLVADVFTAVDPPVSDEAIGSQIVAVCRQHAHGTLYVVRVPAADPRLYVDNFAERPGDGDPGAALRAVRPSIWNARLAHWAAP